MGARHYYTSIPRNHNLPKPRPIETLPKLLFLSDPLRQNRYPNPDFATDGSAQQRVWRRQSGIASQSPDLILLTGDLLNSGEPVTEIATNLISSLCEIAPVYLSLGNHEIEYRDNFGTDITQLYQDAGAIVLEHQYRDITVKGQSLRIGGIYGYCLPDKYLETEEADLSECMFLWDFENTDRYKILLSHLPIAWLKNDALEEWNMDCVFSGHLHGGQVILPGIGGVYAPDMGWFPGRLKGVFDSKDGKRHLVLSAGLGNTEVIPRFNNIPEIVCVDLVPVGSHRSQ